MTSGATSGATSGESRSVASEELRERAFSLHEAGDLAAAEALYREALRSDPQDHEISHALGALAIQSGRFAEAVPLIADALRFRESASAYTDLGNALSGARRFEEAVRCYDRALALQETFTEAHLNRGTALLALGRWHEAGPDLDRAMALGADGATAHMLQGILWRRSGNLDQALASYDAALLRQPSSIEVLCNRANLLLDLRRFEDALRDCDRALAIAPGGPHVLLPRAAALMGLERFKDALDDYDRSILINAHQAEAYAGRASALQHLRRHEEALASADRAIALGPELAAGHFNRGAAVRDLLRIDEAIVSFETARRLTPADADANCNLGGLYLLTGRFDPGWTLYEWRSKLPGAPKRHRYPQPAWNGDTDLKGRTLFAYLDQGLGDTIHFSRYAKLAERRGARVILAVQSSLRRLLSSLGSDIQLLGETEAPETIDLHCPLASLPGAFRTRVDAIPAFPSYLSAEPARMALWRNFIGSAGFKIGICWQGSTMKTGIGRSFPLRMLEQIAGNSHVRLISLQRGTGVEQLCDLPRGMHVEVLPDRFDAGPDAFIDAAALMQSLDLVITCDTSIAHLAGALGRPVFVALKRVPDWRWLLDRSDSPWYPSMRLFRQSVDGRWDSVFDELYREVSSRMTAHPAT